MTQPAGIPDCPACPTDPWVVLAKVVTDDQGNVKQIDNCTCRRMVLSLAPYWWKCNEAPTVVETPTRPGGGEPSPVG